MDRQYNIGPGAMLLAITTTGTAAKKGNWVHYGPILANKITVGRSPTVSGAANSSTKGTVTFEGTFGSTAGVPTPTLVGSTQAVVTIASRTYAQNTSYIASTVALAINFIRIRSSGSTGTGALQYGYVMGVP